MPDYYKFIVVTVIILITLIEAIRLYLGYMGNLQEKVGPPFLSFSATRKCNEVSIARKGKRAAVEGTKTYNSGLVPRLLLLSLWSVYLISLALVSSYVKWGK